MVDRVPLIEVDQLLEVRELERDHPTGLQCEIHPRDEVVDVRDVSQHVVADQQVSPRLGSQRLRRLDAEELDQRGYSLLDRDLGDVRGRLDAKNRDLSLDEVLQQVAVVGGQLEDVARAVEPPALDHGVNVLPGVLQPRARIGREVRVFAEDVLRTLVLL